MADDIPAKAATVRALHDTELPAWLDLLQAAFAQKGVPRSYFEGHVRHDPTFCMDSIRVAVRGSSELLSTARVFFRHMYLNGRWIPVGGVGEVATHPDARRMGLAEMVLADLVAYMQAKQLPLSILHSSNVHLQTYYARHGWHPIPLRFLRAVVNLHALHLAVSRIGCGSAETASTTTTAGAAAAPRADATAPTPSEPPALPCSQVPLPVSAVKRVHLNDPAAVAPLCALHAAQSYNGSFRRDPAMWQQWVAAEAGAYTAWALADDSAYLVARPAGDCLRITEFFAAPHPSPSPPPPPPSSESVSQSRAASSPKKSTISPSGPAPEKATKVTREHAFLLLLNAAVSHHSGEGAGEQMVQVPAAMVDAALLTHCACANVTHTEDRGFMFRILNPADLGLVDTAALERALRQTHEGGLALRGPPADGFAFLQLDSF